jgi:uncharacterized RDD family membrane protein YckC
LQVRTAEPLSNRTYLETPENVRLAFRLAGPGTRLGAYGIDLAIRIGIFYAIAYVLTRLEPLTGMGLTTGVFFVLAFVLEWGYGALFETWWSGQTPGKRTLGLRVIKTEGYAIGFYEAMLRNLLRAADFVPLFYAAGFLASISTSRMQRIGDIVAGTMVIREKRPELKGGLEGLTEFDGFPVTEFEHRYRPSEATLEAIEALFRRRLELAPARVDEIAAVLAEPIGKRLASAEQQRYALTKPSDFLFRVLRSARDTSSEAQAA